jgi:hypothetical protein
VKLINHLSADTRLTKQATYVQRNNEVRSRNHRRCGKQRAFCVLSVFVALIIQRVSACAVLYCYLRPVWLYHIFPHHLINGTILRKKVIEHKICVLIFSADLSQTLLILRKIQRDIIINVRRSSCKVHAIVRF